MVKIRLIFRGGVQEVGRSSIELESNNVVMVFDFGVQVSEPPQYLNMPDYADSLVLSHAHLDHSGMAPALYERQSLPIYCTKPTSQLCQILQEDNLKVTERRGYALPYSKKDIQNSLKGYITVDYKQMRNVHKGIKMEFYDAGHIPGSASILLELEGKRLLYTGDINNRDTRLLKGAVVPKADILVTETTYGNRIHPNRRDSEKALIASIEETVDSGGIALLPVFSVGRSQEILLVLQDLEIPIYLDGLAKLASKIIVSNGKYVKNAQELQKAVNHSIWIEHNNQRKDACKEPCIILTTAGMLNGGPVIQYMRMLAEDKKNSILLTGYQVEGTNGRLLLEKGHVIDPETQKKIIAKALIRQFDFSAHADQEGLLEIARKTSPEEVILVHGSPEATQALKQKMEDEYKVHTPKLNETIEI